MFPRNERVVLCRGVSERNESQEAYVKTLESAGYTCECLSTLRFEFVNGPELRECLEAPQKYLGLILTSRRAVEAVDLASKTEKDILPLWRDLLAYCVGPATESIARKCLGFRNCRGSDSGNAKELAEKILMDVEKESKPLLYPCSEIARETIQQTLDDNGVCTKRLVAYRTMACESLESDLCKLLDSLPKIFVFFSPSTVEHIAKLLKEKTNDMKDIKAVAIGPVTRQTLVEFGFDVFATASKPDPCALLQAIQAANLSGMSGET